MRLACRLSCRARCDSCAKTRGCHAAANCGDRKAIVAGSQWHECWEHSLALELLAKSSKNPGALGLRENTDITLIVCPITSRHSAVGGVVYSVIQGAACRLADWLYDGAAGSASTSHPKNTLQVSAAQAHSAGIRAEHLAAASSSRAGTPGRNSCYCSNQQAGAVSRPVLSWTLPQANPGINPLLPCTQHRGITHSAWCCWLTAHSHHVCRRSS